MNSKERYLLVRNRTVNICSPLETEDFVSQPAHFISPAKWHLAHTTWFFEKFILAVYLDKYEEFNAYYSLIFNHYNNSPGNRVHRSERGNLTRPTVDEVYEYRDYVDKHMADLLLTTNNDEVLSLLELGLNHEEQHHELLIADVKYTLGHNPLYPEYREGGELIVNGLEEFGTVQIPEGVYTVGHNGSGFCFDNEQGRHKVYLHEFEISKSLVSVREYMEFISDGGYERFELWFDEGWEWLKDSKISSPLHWHNIEGVLHHFTMGGMKELNYDSALCHISYYEASAYAAWKGMRLPTEFEWEIASDKFSWGDRWEWTNSAYLPYPNYEMDEGAIGEYSSKFMVNQMVLRGASVATPEGHSRKTYRKFLHPNYQWQFSGIRLVT